MQIITGKYKARKLIHPDGQSTRPTLARIKESIFSMLPLNFENTVVLDLFAGSGAYGIEAISRGAKRAFLVDNNHEAIKAIKLNSRGIDNVEIIEKDCFEALNRFYEQHIKFNYVFLDPPYKSDIVGKVVSFIESHKLLEDGGIIVYEHSIDKNLLPNLLKRYIIIKTRNYGTVSVDFIQNNSHQEI